MSHSNFFKDCLRRAVWLADERLGWRIVRTGSRLEKEVKYLSLAYQCTLRRLFKDAAINCVVDVVANIGQFGQSLRRLGYRGRIESFEPASDPFRALSEATMADPGWSAHQIALGRNSGEAWLNVSRMSNFNSIREPLGRYADLFQSSSGGARDDEVVLVRRLDDVWPEIRGESTNIAGFLKIDTQDFDSEVVAGGEGEALADVLGVQFEASVEHIYQGAPDWYELIEHCKKLGFKVAGIFPCARGDVDEVIELDCLMIRPEIYKGLRPDVG